MQVRDYNMELEQKECIGFIGYLKSRGLAEEATTKEKLRDEYNRHYKYQTNARLPCYSKMLYNMKRYGYIRIKDSEYIYFSRQERPIRQRSVNRNSSRSPTDCPSNNNPRVNGTVNEKPERRRYTRQNTKLNVSVDQHVALRTRNSQRINVNNLISNGDRSIPFQCGVCKSSCNSSKQFGDHQTGRRHKLQCIKFKLDVKKDQLLENKNGVVVTAVNVASQNAGNIEVHRKVDEVKRFNFEVRNEGNDDVELQTCTILKHFSVLVLDDHLGVHRGLKTVPIAAGAKYSILATCNSSNAGYESEPILFQFKRKDTTFQILRNVTIISDSQLTDFLRPVVPYKAPPKSAANRTEVAVVPGLAIDKSEVEDNLEKIIELNYYTIPHNLRTIVNHGLQKFNGISSHQNTLLNNLLVDFEEGLTPDNYCRFFHNLLYLEEIQMEVDIRRYDMDESVMEVVREQDKNHLLQLEVPGLTENRPSIVKGDKIYVRTTNKEYEGIIHMVREKKVWIGFDQEFRNSFINGLKFGVRFTFNRLPTRVGHRAMDLVEEMSLSNFLFPKLETVSEQSKRILESEFRFRNKLIEDNMQQQQAVRAIVAGTSGSAPYLIYGPPGTGKTLTLIEAIKQVLIFHKNARILACAPSNSVADVMAERLVENDPAMKSQIFRLLALSRDYETLPENTRGVCNFNKHENKYFYPPKKTMSNYKVIITTLLTAGRVVSANFPPNHFTHVFIDECGHAIEPEAVIAVAGILKSSPENPRQLVLVGDPKQLGPILRSPIAIKNGLGISFLERLMQKDPYLRKSEDRNGIGSYNSQVITKLLCNYRSHPSLLTIPNKLFYENELKAYADELTRSQFCNFEYLPTKGFPAIFHGVIGKDEQEQRSPSFFNRAEIDVVVDYVIKLLSARSMVVKPEDIGIISPYNRQVHKIRFALENLSRKRDKWKEMQGRDVTRITVGSTEEFQGQERKIIIISTVRSNPDLLKLDFTYKLGFLRNPKRFNVAVTRAKCLMIIVGNPHLLCLDNQWNQYLEYCIKNGAYVGTPYFVDDEEDHLIQKLRNLDLGEEADAVLEQLLGNINLNNVDRREDEIRWRNDI